MKAASLALWLAWVSPQADKPNPIAYTVSMPDPETHLFHVEMRIPNPSGDLHLVMPVWTPGSYKVRDYAQFVQDFEAVGLSFEKVDKTTWKVKAGGAREATVRYRVFAHDMSVRQSWLDSEMGTVVGASVFFYVKGRKETPCVLTVKAKPGWKIATGLEPAGNRTFRAGDYDVLIDSPILLADFKQTSFKVRDVTHHVVVAGPCPPGIDRLRRDFRKIVEKTVALFGDVPYRDYWFLVRSLPGGGGGGLEHLNSTLMDTPTERLATDDGYPRFQSLAAHEFFHTWLVKRLRPKALGPFDYTKENYTKLLWVMEGITSYYTTVILSRAGLWDEKRTLESFAKTRSDLARAPGRLKESPSMASFNAWIHHYQRGPHSPNTSASYYLTGKMLGLALDLEIRRRGEKSLDDVLRGLYREHALKRGRGITSGQFREACEKAAGGDLDELFEMSVRGGDDPNMSPGLTRVGLRFRNDGKKKPYLGVLLNGNRIRSVIDDGPAAGRLSVEDEILAINGLKVDMAKWDAHVRHLKDETPLRIALFRRGYLKTVEVPLRRRVEPDFKMERVKDISPDQKKALAAWLKQR